MQRRVKCAEMIKGSRHVLWQVSLAEVPKVLKKTSTKKTRLKMVSTSLIQACTMRVVNGSFHQIIWRPLWRAFSEQKLQLFCASQPVCMMECAETSFSKGESIDTFSAWGHSHCADHLFFKDIFCLIQSFVHSFICQ